MRARRGKQSPDSPISRRQLAGLVAQRVGVPTSTADEYVTATFDVIADELANAGQVTVRGFGVFETRVVKPVSRFKPGTDEIVHVKAGARPWFRASGSLKRKVNGES